MSVKLTERQAREVDYHRGHAVLVSNRSGVFDNTVATAPRRRWWNAYWSVWTYLRSLPLSEMKVLVVGCGAGYDAMLFASLGAEVSGFDLSPDMLAVARETAERAGLNIRFDECPSEATVYSDKSFDLIFAHDILHHVDIPATMAEIARVAKGDAIFVIDEIYSHSWTDVVRRSRLVDQLIYPRLVRWIYGTKRPYITADERKMSEADIAAALAYSAHVEFIRYYNFIVTRLLPDRWPIICKLDRLLLIALGPLGRFFAGRIVAVAKIAGRS